jgi:hypothetical protein
MIVHDERLGVRQNAAVRNFIFSRHPLTYDRNEIGSELSMETDLKEFDFRDASRTANVSLITGSPALTR